MAGSTLDKSPRGSYAYSMATDLIIIGGGPAGYAAAIRAAQLGKKVVCIEKERVGGTCLNWGCIPTKALLESAEMFRKMVQGAKAYGVNVQEVTADWDAMVARSRAVSDRLCSGIEFLFKKHGIERLQGTASIPAPGVVEITASDGTISQLQASKILIATGARTRDIPAFPMDGTRIIGSKQALTLPRVPSSMLVIGSGAIGSEFSYVYSCLGCKITLVEALPNLLPNEDDEVSKTMERAFKKRGITCLVGAKVESVSSSESGVKAHITRPGKPDTDVEAEVCLVAVGVVPVVPDVRGLQLTERGFVQVNDRYETNLPGVYAAGDCIGGVMLAHAASYEAVQAVEGMFLPGATPKKPTLVPGCTYCHPQVASIGKRERELKQAGIAYKVGKFPFQAIGRAVAAGETEGFVKLLFGSEHGELLGAHIVGEGATELIATPQLGISAELTDEDLHAAIFAHPTLSEAIHEATLAADGIPIHA